MHTPYFTRIRVKSVFLYFIPVYLGVVLISSAMSKAIDRSEIMNSLTAINVAWQVAALITSVVVVSEVYLGLMLLRTPVKQYIIRCAIGMFLVYVGYLLYISTLANPPKCGCSSLMFTFKSNRDAALYGALRNMLYIYLMYYYAKCSFRAHSSISRLSVLEGNSANS